MTRPPRKQKSAAATKRDAAIAVKKAAEAGEELNFTSAAEGVVGAAEDILMERQRPKKKYSPRKPKKADEIPEEAVPNFNYVIVDKNNASFRANPLLKKPGVLMNPDPAMVEEYRKCASDPDYFIRRYMKIVHVDRGLIPFHMYDYQKKIVKTVRNNRYSLINMCRQSGKSTAIVGFVCHYMLFNDFKNIAILANKESTAMEILGRVQRAYQHLPMWLQSGVTEWNKKTCELENGCKITAAATSSDTIRGHSFSVVIIDEAAHIEGWEDFFTSVYPTISSGAETKLVLISTPKGLNHFYKLWRESEQGKNEYERIEVQWKDVPGRDLEWKEKTLAAMSYNNDKFAQEYECSFLGSSNTLIAGWKLKELIWEEPINEKDGLRQYDAPKPKRNYAITVDVSEGKGLDYSTFVVSDISQMPYKMVCCFRSNQMTATDFGTYVHHMAIAYNQAHVLVETNVPMGYEVARYLYSDLEYENVIFTKNRGRKGLSITTAGGDGVMMGLKTSKQTKASGCSLLKMLVEGNQYVINDFHTIEELNRFSKNTRGLWAAEEGSHDDMTMCLVNFAWMTGQDYFLELTDINTMDNLSELEKDRLGQEMMKFGYIDNHQPEEETTPFNELGVDPDRAFEMMRRDQWNWESYITNRQEDAFTL